MQADEGGFEGAKPTALLHEAVRCAAQASTVEIARLWIDPDAMGVFVSAYAAHLSKKKAKYTRQTPRIGRALQNHPSQKKLQFQRAAAKKREAGLEPCFAYMRRAYAGYGAKQGL